MSTTLHPIPTSRLRFGLGRVDITPPVGIYQRMWGAATHDRASGIHRPLTAEVLQFKPLDGDDPGMVRAQIDLVGIDATRYAQWAQIVSEAANVPQDRVVITFAHTHAAGMMTPDRVSLPGGELIPDYLAEVEAKLRQATVTAVATLQIATITYARGRCDLAANRDYWDDTEKLFTCGFNPDAPADDTVIVARVTDAGAQTLAVLVNYACHPTTLAWENSLISPDYIGAMREEIERQTGAPCVFLQGACGDLGPKQGFVGDTRVADWNGRQLAFAALSALASMGAPATDYVYTGPVISGATLGTWAFQPLSPIRGRRDKPDGGRAFPCGSTAQAQARSGGDGD